MLDPADDTKPDARIFQPSNPITMADVVARIAAEAPSNQRRDTLSAFRVLEDRAGVRLDATLASGVVTRDVLTRLNARELGVGSGRLANIRSLVRKAVARFGMPRMLVTREIPLSSAWTSLIESMPLRAYRFGLSRLACYASAKGIPPADISNETLLGLHRALEADCQIGDPRRIIKHTISVWNMCARAVQAWPRIRLSSPFKATPYMLPIDAFPPSFRADVENWSVRMSTPDLLDTSAPIMAYRPATLQGYIYAFRRLASALVHTGTLPIEQITGVGVLLSEANLKAALRPYLPSPGDGRHSGYAHKMVVQMGVVARYLDASAECRDAIKRLAKRLDPRTNGRMGRRNTTRLRQFDDTAVVRRFIAFPEEELGRALLLSNPGRRAKGVERALAISLSIFVSLRARNLRTLRLDENIRRENGRVTLRFDGTEMKAGSPHEIDLEPDTIRLLDLFLNEHRTYLPGSEGPYLFPSPDGGPRSYSAMREAVSIPLRKHMGIEASPHLYRHIVAKIVAKIVAERDPGMLPALARRLGHANLRTTYQAYLGTETVAASRQVNKLLDAARQPDPDGNAR